MLVVRRYAGVALLIAERIGIMGRGSTARRRAFGGALQG
jgi:hypothetical protein